MKHPNDLESSQQRLGGIMVVIGWILAIALLTFLLVIWDENRTKPDYIISDTGHTLIIPRDSDGHFRLDGTINNVPVSLMVDTGATRIAIPLEVAQQAGMPQKSAITIHTANGPTQGYLSTIKRLELEAFVLTNVPAIISPSMHRGEVLLGMNVLSKFTTIQDAKTLKIQLK